MRVVYAFQGGGSPMIRVQCDGCANQVMGAAPRQIQVQLHQQVRALDFCGSCFVDPLKVERALGKAVQSMREAEGKPRGERAHERETFGAGPLR